jgi:hypothetical protein
MVSKTIVLGLPSPAAVGQYTHQGLRPVVQAAPCICVGKCVTRVSAACPVTNGTLCLVNLLAG